MEIVTKEMMEAKPFLIALLFVAATLALLFLTEYLYGPRHLPNEPPVVDSSIPFVGHIIGLLRHGHRYYQVVR